MSNYDYYVVLYFSSGNNFQIHLKYQLNESFTSNYFIEGWEAPEANTSIRPIFNHCKLITLLQKIKQWKHCSRPHKKHVHQEKKIQKNSAVRV